MPGLITIWNYTTLKLSTSVNIFIICLITIWNYTTLKLWLFFANVIKCLITIWNYTTLKRSDVINPICCSLITIWNYTTLKLLIRLQLVAHLFDYHMKLHYSQTDGVQINALHGFDYHMKLHYSQTCFSWSSVMSCLITIWNYTTLKRSEWCC